MKKKLVFIITSLIILFLTSVKILISLELIDKDIFISSISNAKKYFEPEQVGIYNIGYEKNFNLPLTWEKGNGVFISA